MSGTALTNAEWNEIKDRFPHLVRDETRKTGNATPAGGSVPQYNCLAWTVGVTNQNLYPRDSGGGSKISDLTTFYSGYEFEKTTAAGSTDGIIDGWGTSVSDSLYLHASRKNATLNKWESKDGASGFRMTHARNGLRGADTDYGNIKASYKKKAGGRSADVIIAEAAASLQPLDASPINSLVNAIQKAFPNLVIGFEQCYQAWKGTWFAGELATVDSPGARARGKEWDALVALGPKVLPLVVGKVQSKDEIFAYMLYAKLQPNTERQVKTADSVVIYCTLSLHAMKIVKLYLGLIAEFEAHAATLTTPHVSLSSEHLTFKAVTSMNAEEILPLVMVKYSENKAGAVWKDILSVLLKERAEGITNFQQLSQRFAKL